MIEYICSCLHLPKEILTTTKAEAKTKKKKSVLKGILRRKKKEKRTLTQQPTISLESNQEPEARAPSEYKCGMEEMTFVGEVIRDDFVTPISQDITHIHHNIIETALRRDAVLVIHNECIAPYFDNGFARKYDEANAAHSLHQLQQKHQQKHQQLHPELMRGAGDSNISQSSTEKVANTMSSPKVKRTKTYCTRGIRAQGTKKTDTNETMGISEGGEKQTTTIRVRRRRSYIGSE
jgi:hypothetical protein